jgi:ribosomal protein S18 acetylase RimI-like enzyme
VADKIVIRPASEGDAGDLAALSAPVQELHVAERPDVFKPVDLGSLASWFRDAIKDPAWQILIAEISGAAVGYVAVTDNARGENVFARARRWREIEQLAVSASHRRQGIAGALLDRVAESATADGVVVLELNTWAFNDVARRCFQRLGFTERNLRYQREATRSRS